MPHIFTDQNDCLPVICLLVYLFNILDWEFAATVFGQNLKLEPLKPEKKAMWKREMSCLMSVCDYIVEFAPTAQYLDDGTIVEVNYFYTLIRLSVHFI
jgi:hypothetical protein